MSAMQRERQRMQTDLRDAQHAISDAQRAVNQLLDLRPKERGDHEIRNVRDRLGHARQYLSRVKHRLDLHESLETLRGDQAIVHSGDIQINRHELPQLMAEIQGTAPTLCQCDPEKIAREVLRRMVDDFAAVHHGVDNV